MQFSTIYGEVASNFPTANVNRVKLAVNAAYHEFLAARQWSWSEISSATIALVASQQAYALTGTTPVVPDFDGMISVVMELSTGVDRKKLREMKQADFDDVFGHVTTPGEPAVYCLRGGIPAASSATVVQGGQTQLALAPVPLATATHGQQLILRYFRSVSSIELTADADIPIIPNSSHYALILGANAYMHEAIGNVPKAQQFQQLFQQRLQMAMTDDMGLRLRDQQLLTYEEGPTLSPVTGQTPASYDRNTRPYDRQG